MSNKNQYRINRKPEILQRFGFSKSTLHYKINLGVFPPPISLGARSVGFLEHELDATIKAMAEGKKDSELKALVASLVIQRQQAV